MNFFDNDSLIQACLSKPQTEDTKLHIHPVKIKSKRIFQFSIHSNNQVRHLNLEPEEAKEVLKEYLERFKEGHFYTREADFLAIKNKKGTWKWFQSKPTKTFQLKQHNREKNYLLTEHKHALFWKALGVANASGKIKPEKQAKFRQVNRFIEIISTILPSLSQKDPLRIVDFGCGKAYLTFALYEYLVKQLNRSIEIIGIDRKAEVVNHLEKIRTELQYNSLKFFVGDIETYSVPSVDLVISLHACDTATDKVIKKSIQANAKVILAVPCCQHAFYAQIKQTHLNPLLKHGILKERFAALVTDAARAAFLEASGYLTQIIEFIDTEHTPKNLMLKAIKSDHPIQQKTAQEFKEFLAYLSINKFCLRTCSKSL